MTTGVPWNIQYNRNYYHCMDNFHNCGWLSNAWSNLHYRSWYKNHIAVRRNIFCYRNKQQSNRFYFCREFEHLLPSFQDSLSFSRIPWEHRHFFVCFHFHLSSHNLGYSICCGLSMETGIIYPG